MELRGRIDCSLRRYAPSSTAFHSDDVRVHCCRLRFSCALCGTVATRVRRYVQSCRGRDQADQRRADALSTGSAPRQPSLDARGATAGGSDGTGRSDGARASERTVSKYGGSHRGGKLSLADSRRERRLRSGERREGARQLDAFTRPSDQHPQFGLHRDGCRLRNRSQRTSVLRAGLRAPTFLRLPSSP